MQIKAWACHQPGGRLQEFTYTRPAPGEWEVALAISHCALCHSDLHLIEDDWGISRYPLVPGHEIIGTVSAKGSRVRDVELGERVGVGWQSGACLRCERCRGHGEQYCATAKHRTCVDAFGGFAEAIVVDSRFVYRIPDKLASHHAAPLLCAGVTVFRPLLRYKLGPGKRIGIVGLGGLGHLAVQFAARLGCAVRVFDPDKSKEADARRLGAHEFVGGADENNGARQAEPLDFVLVTTSANVDWARNFNSMALGGTLCVVGVPSRPLSIPVEFLQDEDHSLTGSIIGSRSDMRQMLDFAAQHEVLPWVETLPIRKHETALQQMRQGRVRYRLVLAMEPEPAE